MNQDENIPVIKYLSDCLLTPPYRKLCIEWLSSLRLTSDRCPVLIPPLNDINKISDVVYEWVHDWWTKWSNTMIVELSGTLLDNTTHQRCTVESRFSHYPVE